jgi:hypothetical protein
VLALALTGLTLLGAWQRLGWARAGTPVRRVWAAALTGVGMSQPAFCRTAACGVGDIGTDLPGTAFGWLGLSTDPQGRLWVYDRADYSRAPAYRVGLDGRIDRVLSVPGGAHVVAAAPDGTIYAASEIDSSDDDARIFEIDPSGHRTWLAGELGHQNIESDLADCVAQKCGDGGPPRQARFTGVSQLLVDAHGDLLIADDEHARIRMITPDGAVSTIVGSNQRCIGYVPCSQDGELATDGSFNEPYAMALAPDGSLWFADAAAIPAQLGQPGDSTLWRVTTDGRLRFVLRARFWGLTISPHGIAYVRLYEKGRRPRLVSVSESGVTQDLFGAPRSTCDPSFVALTCGDGLPAQRMSLSTQVTPAWLASDPWGGIFLADAGGEVRYIEPPGRPGQRLGLVIHTRWHPPAVKTGEALVMRYRASEPVTLTVHVMRIARSLPRHRELLPVALQAHGASGTISWVARVRGRRAPAGLYVLDVVAHARGRVTSRQTPIWVVAG